MIKHIETQQLNIAYLDLGSPDGIPVFLMHGFPYDVHSYDDVAEILTQQGLRCIIPYLRGYGPTSFKSPHIFRSGQQAAIGTDLLELMNALNISQAILGGYDWGGRAACIVSALWPERVLGLVSCGTGYNIQNIAEAETPAAAETEFRFWYQYYFHTERGRRGLELNRRELCQFIWKLWSPSWLFDNKTYEQTANSFENPDFTEVVIHSYRHRFGLAAGDPEFNDIESRLARQPPISLPTVVLEGADDGVDPPSGQDVNAQFFTAAYRHRIIPGAGHNIPQEVPAVFAEAVLSLV